MIMKNEEKIKKRNEEWENVMCEKIMRGLENGVKSDSDLSWGTRYNLMNTKIALFILYTIFTCPYLHKDS